ncbi:hypothetical protein D3C79_774950 [compost metagenome]
MVVCGLGAFVGSLGDKPLGQLVVGMALMTFLVLVAFGTARALSQSAGAKLVTTMLWLNWSMIGFFAIGIGAVVLGTFASPDVLLRMLVKFLPGALTLVIPQSINIMALRTLRATR